MIGMGVLSEGLEGADSVDRLDEEPHGQGGGGSVADVVPVENDAVGRAAEMIQLAVMMGCITQASAQEESEGDSDWWFLGVMSIFAIVGMITCGILVYRGALRWWRWTQRMMRERKEGEGPCDEAMKLKQKPHARRRPRVLGAENRGSEKATGSHQPADVPSSTEVDGVGGADAVPVADERHDRRGAEIKALITPYGERWHVSERCPTLANTRDMWDLNWCERCGAKSSFSGDIFLERRGAKVAHRDHGCVKKTKETLAFRACLKCPDPSRRSTA